MVVGFFKTYTTEYNIRFSGDKDKVEKAIEMLKTDCENFNEEIELHRPVSATTVF